MCNILQQIKNKLLFTLKFATPVHEAFPKPPASLSSLCNSSKHSRREYKNWCFKLHSRRVLCHLNKVKLVHYYTSYTFDTAAFVISNERTRSQTTKNNKDPFRNCNPHYFS